MLFHRLLRPYLILLLCLFLAGCSSLPSIGSSPAQVAALQSLQAAPQDQLKQLNQLHALSQAPAQQDAAQVNALLNNAGLQRKPITTGQVLGYGTALAATLAFIYGFMHFH